jgi:hypothetical protein
MQGAFKHINNCNKKISVDLVGGSNKREILHLSMVGRLTSLKEE